MIICILYVCRYFWIDYKLKKNSQKCQFEYYYHKKTFLNKINILIIILQKLLTSLFYHNLEIDEQLIHILLAYTTPPFSLVKSFKKKELNLQFLEDFLMFFWHIFNLLVENHLNFQTIYEWIICVWNIVSKTKIFCKQKEWKFSNLACFKYEWILLRW